MLLGTVWLRDQGVVVGELQRGLAGCTQAPVEFWGCEGRVRHGWYEHRVRVSWGWRGVFNWWPQNVVREGQERVRHCNLASGLARRAVRVLGCKAQGTLVVSVAPSSLRGR